MSAPIRPPSPKISENDVVIHRSKSYYERVSPLCSFITCLSKDTITELQKNSDGQEAHEAHEFPFGDEMDGPTHEQYRAARRWLKEHDIVSQDAFMKRVREKQFGNVMKNELNLPKRK